MRESNVDWDDWEPDPAAPARLKLRDLDKSGSPLFNALKLKYS